METEGSFPCTQEPITRSYPKGDESTPHPSQLSLSPILILSSHVRLGLPRPPLPQGFPTRILYADVFSSMRAT